MRKSRFAEVQVIGMIKEKEAAMPSALMCRRHGITTASLSAHTNALPLISRM